MVAAIALFILAGCNPRIITSPGDGTIVAEGTLTVSGVIPDAYAPGGTLTVDGAVVPYDAEGNWSTDVAVSGYGTTEVVEAIYTEPGGTAHRQRQAVVAGPSIGEGEYSQNGVGMRFTNDALSNLGPIINDLAGSSFDISGLILAQDPLINTSLSGINVTGSAYEAGAGGVNLAVASAANGVNVNVSIADLYLGLNLNLGSLLGNCKLEVVVPNTSINARFDLRPAPGNENYVDVNMIGAPTVTTSSVDYEFISGVCDPSTPIVGSIVNALAGGSIPATIGDGFSSQLADPDGAGPLDSPIADAIETALSEISIAGSVGDAVQAQLDAPFTTIDETAGGIEFRSNADFRSVIGAGAGECIPAAGSPAITNTFDTPGTYPTLGTTTPSGDPYGLGLVISNSAFNQLLGVMTACGLLNQDVTEIEFGGSLVTINSSVLSLIVPAFGTALPPATPMFIRVDPVYSPFLDGDAGPSGEMAELTLADLHIQFVQPAASGDVVWLTLGVDAPLGIDMAFDPAQGALAPTITPPVTGTVDVRVLDNKVGADETGVEALFAGLFPSFVSGLSESFAAFPLPSFLGLQLNVVEMARQGNSFVLYANLDLQPQTRLENVQVTDTSTGDFSKDSFAIDSWEWRHRLRKQVSSTNVAVQLKGMIGYDACCVWGDGAQSATASGRVAFDVVPENGETWNVDLNHMIQGAHTHNDEGHKARSKVSTVTGRYRVGSGAWINFNFNPSNMDSGERDSQYLGPFTGSSSTVITGTTAANVTVEFSFGVEARSMGNWIRGGREAAVRFGVNDSLTNDFTAGDYPGIGNRDVAADGYRLNIALSNVG